VVKKGEIDKKKEHEIEMEKEIVKFVLEISMEFGQEKKGSFFVITDRDIKKHYKLLYPDLFNGKDINIKQKEATRLLKKLAELDGAIILSDNGKIINYGAEIIKTSVYKGYGTRHSAALGISKIPEVTAITASEEDGCVRIFKAGRLLVEINPLTKTPKTLSDRISDMITNPNLPLLGGGGLASLAFGVNPLMAAIIFTGSYIITKGGMISLGDFLKSREKSEK